VVAICLFLSAITATAIRMRHQHGRRKASPIAVEKRPAQKSDGTSAALTMTPVPAHSQPQTIEQTLRPQKPLAKTETSPVAQPEPRKDTAGSVLTDGEIHQVLPDIPQKARDTIHGTVRVSVKVSVDAAGRVTQAELDSAGPSRYFANLAVQAAQKWTFGAAKGGDSAALRAWTVHFAFTPTDTKARAVPEVR
jgi:TonB family protein